jgi:hypothetical protein
VRFGLAALLLVLAATPAWAQKDWFNLDRGHPFEVTDARALERRAIELQLSPLDLTRREGGVYGWTIAPSLSAGLLPRTEFELGVPWSWSDGPDSRGGLAGVELGLLHALNIETRTLPAFALEAEVLLPVGSEAPDAAFATLGALATRTLGRSRVHLNASGTLGPSAEAHRDQHRWRTGLALDRALPLAATLLGAEVVAAEPFADGAALDWDVGLGGRRQLTPRLVMDAGVRYRVAGNAPGWGVRMGFGWMTALSRSRVGPQ